MDGVLNLLKPPGMTSSDAVVDVRRLLHEKKAGHTGTLDPGATGVLPICLGRATRLFDYLVDKEKEYRAEITFGLSTDTLDAYGRVTEKAETCITESELESVLKRFLGEQAQFPPAYSAVKVNGKKLCELARKGETEAELRARTVTISAISLLDRTGPQSFLIDVRCSRGTYIRTLCSDIGKALSAPAYMSFLLRMRSGRFKIQDALTIQELAEAAEAQNVGELLTGVEEALDFLPAVEIDERWLDKLKNGNPSPKEMVIGHVEGKNPLRVYCAGEFFGVGELFNGELRMRTMLYQNQRR